MVISKLRRVQMNMRKLRHVQRGLTHDMHTYATSHKMWNPIGLLQVPYLNVQLSDIRLQQKKQMKTLQYVSVNFMFFWVQ
jgi:hypothetical protein